MTMKNLIFIIGLSISNFSYSAICNSIGSGNWNNPLIWSCGVVPSPGDVITIGLGDIVTISINTDMNGIPTILYIDGVLLFDSPGAKLRLECGSSVVISGTGEIRDSGNGTPSHSLRICGVDEWTGIEGSLFGPLVIGVTPLSIELVEFSVEKLRNELNFKWITATENNNDYFTIEASSDNSNWDAIEIMAGAGNSSEEIYYELLNSNGLAYSYFRLRQTDYDGTSTLSKSIHLSNSESSELSVFPNPWTNGRLSINSSFENYSVYIYHASGIMVSQIANSNGSFVEIENENFEKGVYFIKISNGNDLISKKLVIN